MEKSFLEYYDFCEGVCKERLHLQGQNMRVAGFVLASFAAAACYHFRYSYRSINI